HSAVPREAKAPLEGEQVLADALARQMEDLARTGGALLSADLAVGQGIHVGEEASADAPLELDISRPVRGPIDGGAGLLRHDVANRIGSFEKPRTSCFAQRSGEPAMYRSGPFSSSSVKIRATSLAMGAPMQAWMPSPKVMIRFAGVNS